MKGKETTIGAAVYRIQNHFNGVDKQQRVKAKLSTLTLDQFIRKNNRNLREGLCELATYITNRTPQCPPNFRSEENKFDFLRQAVIGNEWAMYSAVLDQLRSFNSSIWNLLLLCKFMMNMQGVNRHQIHFQDMSLLHENRL